jgi:predicted ATPase
MDITNAISKLKSNSEAKQEKYSQDQHDEWTENLIFDVQNRFFEQKGLEYQIDEDNKKQFQLLSWYFSKNPRFENAENKTGQNIGNYGLKKGLMILGNVGCGKTTMIKAFQESLKFVNAGFVIHSCLDVESDFARNGYEALDSLHKPYQKMFDDLGFDDVVKHFGNEERIMIRVIEKRERLFEDLGIKTHYTTNLSGKAIFDRYGERTHSRLKGSTNIINFATNAKDRRGSN